jgi:hypothetical protein
MMNETRVSTQDMQADRRNTSWSVVERTPARGKAAASGNVLVYLIRQGGSWFENGAGQ